MPEIYLGAKCRSESGLFPGGSLRLEDRGLFTGLTPRMLSHIPETVLPASVRDGLKVHPGGAIKVHERVLRAGLANLGFDTAVIETIVGEEFRTLTPVITKFGELVPVMEQALACLRPASDGYQDGKALTAPGARVPGFVVAAMTPEIADSRGVFVWLDGLNGDYPESHDHQNELGMHITIKRIMSSLLDHVSVWVPLGITVEQFERVG